MALIVCKDCKKEFSTDAKRCPHCGAKKKGNRLLFWGLVAFLTYAVIVPFVKGTLATSQPPAHEPPHAISSNADTAPMQESKTGWQMQQEKSDMDDSKTVILSKEAEHPIDVWLSKPTPTLIIRCLERKTELYMITNSAAQPELGKYNRYTVEIRIDDKKPYKELWKQSTDSKGLFATNAVALAKELSKAKRLLIRFTPFNASPTTAEFIVTGLDAGLPQLASACKWNP